MNTERPDIPDRLDIPEQDPLQDPGIWRSQLVKYILRIQVVLSGVGVLFGAYNAYLAGNFGWVPFYFLVYAGLLVLAFWKRVSFVWQAGGLLALNYLIGVLGLVQTGVGGYGHFFMLVTPVMTLLFFNLNAGIIAAIFVVLTEIGFGWAFSDGALAVASPTLVEAANPRAWGSQIGVLVVLSGLLIAMLNYVIPRFERTLRESRELGLRLSARNAQLERWADERTKAVERRTRMLETAARVAQEVSGFRNLDAVLNQTVQLIAEQFGFYHVGIFLLDSAGDYIELRAASSPEGQHMLKQGHRLRVGSPGAVGFVAANEKPQVARDRGEDTVHFDNPDLTKTRAELALPLRAQGRIIGVLDVHSERVDAFVEEEVVMLQALADQIALVMQSTELLQEAEERMSMEREMLSEASRAGWRRLLRRQGQLGFRRSARGLNKADTAPLSLRRRQAMQSTELVVDPQDERAVALPILVRGAVVGFIDVRKPEEAAPWTEDELAILRQLGEQLEIALESARLYQETRRRAAREQVVREVTDNIRASLTVEEAVQRALAEVQQLVGASEVVARLGVGHPGAASQGGGTT
jgi:GAF domain-containing protein